MIISVPYEYEQDELYGNYHEKHLQPDINKEYMEKHYLYLNLVSQEIMSSSGAYNINLFLEKRGLNVFNLFCSINKLIYKNLISYTNCLLYGLNILT
jgi:hypothetical protein